VTATRNAKVLVCDTIAQEGLDKLAEAGEVTVKTGLSEDELCGAAADVDAIVVRSSSRVTAKVLAAAPHLRIVGRAGVGVDNIDVGEASARGIVVVNSPEGNTRAAAEHAIALLLAVTRSIPEGDSRMRGRNWKRSDLLGNEVRGKVLGLVGLGKVGSQVGRMARGLGMRVIANDLALSDDRCRQLDIEPKELDDLLREADFVSLHVPLTESTRGMIGEREIALMKPAARVVNSSRGGVIDEAALAAALKEGSLAGAAIDVYSSEPSPPWDSPLMDAPNTVLTPHLGASTTEAQIGAAMDVAEQIVEVLQGGPPRHAVNLPMIIPEEFAELRPWLALIERMGLLVSHLAKGGLRAVRVTYSGGVAAYDCTMATRRFIVGLLRRVVSGEINDVNAIIYANERGAAVSEVKVGEHPVFQSLVRAEAECDEGTFVVEGSLRGRGEPRVVLINEFRVDVEPVGRLLLLEAPDQPGVIGKVGTLLGSRGINIAQMHVGQSASEPVQLMVLNLEGDVPSGVLNELTALECLRSVHLVDLPPVPPLADRS